MRPRGTSNCCRHAVLSAATVTALAGCGSSAHQTPDNAISAGEVTADSDGVQAITLVSADDYRFVPAEFTVAPGRVRVTLDNLAAELTHSMVFPPGSASSLPSTQGTLATIGTYQTSPVTGTC